ncbi:DUF4123 domain-containing protein [Pseudomonas huaxiensis]|uniref:DUF4123 domain-containing protein n=1 Tax=Pseudomonas huaxiensis TaxID=2213017 RepID=UPI000DA644C0|nr:DUF4123 domain-containing protein [Pseudomonas huaxiensis]
MNIANPEQWLDLLEAGCAQVASTHLDLLIDQANCQAPLLAGIQQFEPAMPWRMLFDALPESGAAHLGPLLVRIDLHQPLQRLWLEELIHELGDQSRLLALVSRWPFERLGTYLSQCLEVLNGGRGGVLRYYDPRLFPLLFSHVLDPDQQRQLLCPAVFWSWLDLDGQPRHQTGTAAPAEGFYHFQTIELSDRQLDRLCCASDTWVALSELAAGLPTQWGAEQRFQACYAAMLEADEAGLMVDTQRQAFVLDRIHAG